MMRLLCSSLEMMSPAIAHVHIENHHELLAVADDIVREAKPEASGVISDGSGQGKLIEENTLKSGRMVFIEEESTDERLIRLQDFILERCREYLVLPRKATPRAQDSVPAVGATDIEMERTWIIDQRAGDYQFLHSHIPNILSGIIYLEVPECMNVSTYPDGILTLIETNPFIVLPAAGDMYIWPAYMLHSVYPFRGDGRRVAISFNVKDKTLGYNADVYFKPTYVQTTREQYFRRSPLSRNFT